MNRLRHYWFIVRIFVPVLWMLLSAVFWLLGFCYLAIIHDKADAALCVALATSSALSARDSKDAVKKMIAEEGIDP